MENPFKTIGEAFTAGLEKLHKRADSVEEGVKTFKTDVETFKSEVASDMESIADIRGRLAKLEDMFAPEAVAAVADKVQAAGSDGTATAESGPTSADDVVKLAVPDADPVHISAAIIASDATSAAGGTLDAMKAAAAQAATNAGASPDVATKIADAVPVLPDQGQGVTSPPEDPIAVATITNPTPTTTIAVVPAGVEPTPAPAAAAPVTTTTPSGATVTVDPAAGATTHVDSVAGITTTLDHATGAATAVDATATTVEPAPAVVAEAVSAAAEAGVTVPVQG